MPSSDNAAVYARFSTDRQDARSIDDQVRRCKVLAKARGLHVVDEYSDAAISGTHMDRVDLQRLVVDAGKKRFRVVLVDDLSRLSRDLGDVWQMVFGTFASMNVVVIDCMTGIASDSPAARMTFGAMGLVSDGFVQMIRQETHRGLEGRVLGGFWAGGRVYGYTTQPEANPPDRENIRKVSVIEPNEAVVVHRVFKDFAAGKALKIIADELNREGIGAPHDGGKGNKTARGWGHTTIRSMLLNQRYCGRLTWNQSKWVKVPGKKGRRRIMRPESEWIVREAPELEIIPTPLWHDVQSRFRRTPKGRGNKPGVGKAGGSMFSGLLKCGVCGGSFQIVGRQTKAGKMYTSLGCSVSRSRGESICSNRRSVDERRLIEHVRAELEALANHPEALQVFVDAYQERLSERQKADNTAHLEQELAQARRRLDNLRRALMDMADSFTVRDGIMELEGKARQLEAQIAVSRQRVVIPHRTKIEAELRDLLSVMSGDIPRAREALGKLTVSPFKMIPEADGYRFEGGLMLGLAPVQRQPLDSSVLAGSCSGGKI